MSQINKGETTQTDEEEDLYEISIITAPSGQEKQPLFNLATLPTPIKVILFILFLFFIGIIFAGLVLARQLLNLGENTSSFSPSTPNDSCDCGFRDSTNQVFWTNRLVSNWSDIQSLHFRSINETLTSANSTSELIFEEQQVVLHSDRLELSTLFNNKTYGSFVEFYPDNITFGHLKIQAFLKMTPGTVLSIQWGNISMTLVGNNLDQTTLVSGLLSNSSTADSDIAQSNNKDITLGLTNIDMVWLPSRVRYFLNNSRVHSFADSVPDEGAKLSFKLWNEYSNTSSVLKSSISIDRIALYYNSTQEPQGNFNCSSVAQACNVA